MGIFFIVYIVFWRLPKNFQNMLLLLASYIFCRSWDRKCLSLSDGIDFYLCKALSIYANRGKISKRVLDLLPKYRQLTRSLNNNIPYQQKALEDANYSHLSDIIQLADSVGCKIWFCAMPVQKSYVIKDEIISIIKKSKYSRLYDLRNYDKYGDIHFLDGYHLNQYGATIFTTDLIENLRLAN